MRVRRKTFKSLAVVWTFTQHGSLNIAVMVIHVFVARSEGVEAGTHWLADGWTRGLQISLTVPKFLWPMSPIVFIHGLGLSLREGRVLFRSSF